jgi:hypothetical protein
MATPTPPAPTAPLSVAAPAPLKPGYATSEGWLSALAIALGGLPAFLKALGVTYDISPLVQAVGLIISGLTGMHYTAQRRILKTAHLAAGTAANSNASSVVTPALAAAAAVVAFVALVACGAGKTTGAAIIDGAGSAAEAGLHCEAVNLEQDVTINGTTLSLIKTVGADLLSANWAAAIVDLIKALGGQAVGCAVIAWQDFESTVEGTGSGSATPLALATGISTRDQVALSRAQQLIAKYNWHKAPKTSFRTHSASTDPADQGARDMSAARKAAAGSAAP